VGSKAEVAVAFASAATLSIGALFAAVYMISDATHVQQNILKKEVQSKTLSPGESTSGFLYIPVPKNAPQQKTRLRVTITMAGTDEPLVLDLVF
jgi:hypothetical protein